MSPEVDVNFWSVARPPARWGKHAASGNLNLLPLLELLFLIPTLKRFRLNNFPAMKELQKDSVTEVFDCVGKSRLFWLFSS